MKTNTKQITLEEAKKLAEKDARHALARFLPEPSAHVFEDFYLEEQGGWMFFRNRVIVIPPEHSLTGDWAYVVSKHGEVRQFPDLFCDLVKAKEHHKKLSDYFLANGL
jgi:hypothetical protein